MGQPVMNKMETLPVCPVCDSRDWRKRHQINEWSINECRRCSFAMVYPVPVSESRPEMYKEDKVVERNTKKRHPVVEFSRKMKQWFSRASGRSKGNIFQQKVQLYVPAGGVILDIGCGDGGFINSLKDRYQCWGLEISDYLAQKAREKGGLHVIQSDFEKADFGGQKFDAITIISLIEHLTDPLLAIQKCYALLKDNGVLILKTPNYHCLNHTIFRQDQWTGLRPPDHVVYFSPSNLVKLLTKTGFRNPRITAWPFNDNMYCDVWK